MVARGGRNGQWKLGVLVGVLVACAAAVGLRANGEVAVAATAWRPSRPVEYIVPWGAGGGADALARFTSVRLERYFGVPFPVLNVPGGTGSVGIARLLAGAADGHAIAVYIGDTHALLATGAASWSLRDLVPLVRLQKMPSFLFVRRDAKWKDFEELERDVKANPGRYKTAILGKGSIDELTLSFMAARGFQTVLVPYASPSERYASLLGGHTDILYEQAGDVLRFLRAGEMRPVLVFNETRLKEFPQVPSSRERGYPVYLPQFRTIVTKAGVGREVVAAYERAFLALARDPEFKRFNAEDNLAAEDSILGADATRAFLERELSRMSYLMEQLGLKRR
jgi:tripartite-type tricarboxylate transporter receptor subunit TctC